MIRRKQQTNQGRWISPDPAGLAAVNPADPQSWNRYSYVGNRPLNAVDPLGLSPTDPEPERWPCDAFLGCGEGGGGGGCDPSDASCEPEPPGCDPFFGCGPIAPPSRPGPGPGLIGHGGGGGGRRIGGKWPNGETLGLPTGLNLKPMGLAELIGLSPGTSCDLGVCGTIGNGLLSGGLPSSLATDSSLLVFLSAIVQLKLRIGAGTASKWRSHPL